MVNNRDASLRLSEIRALRRRCLFTLKRAEAEAIQLVDHVPTYRKLEFETEGVVIRSALTALDHEGAPLGLSKDDECAARRIAPKLREMLRDAS